ncbi:MAG TPA: 4Fe-4S double cluster binding domain-containing protein [Terriglobales bacterium]|nr:4Fe-4S double cluster binding domain-containing protein [Terriglobales bacterium]
MDVTYELRSLMAELGADLADCADLADLGCGWPRGLAVAKRIPPEVLSDMENGPTRLYYDTYHALNSDLDKLMLAAEDFLTAQGHAAWAQTTGRVVTVHARTLLPHKSIAMRAGLGWLGKSNLLVTPQYGSAVRLSSLVTDAPLTPGAPMPESRCGGCTACLRACPAGAIRGTLWQAGTDRDEMFDMPACDAKARTMSLENYGISTALCGQCFLKCPYTLRALRK